MRNLRIPILLLIAVLLAVPAASAQSASGEGMKRFYGSYVGSGTAERMDTQTTEKRDLDVMIGPYKDKGFTVTWITVVRPPDGDRTSAGVKRREVKENFLPYEGKENIFIDAPSGGLFSKAELPNPLKGEPLRWAAVDGDTLTVYSMAITKSGQSELQVYHRTLTEKGMNISFMRMNDETVLVRLSGELVKAQ